MKRLLENALSSLQWLLLFLLPLPVKLELLEDEFCRPEDKINTAMPFRVLHKDVCPLIKNVLLEKTYECPLECAMKCTPDPFCVGYNFKKKQLKKPNCQLTHSLHHKFDSCSKDDKGWNFYHPVAPRKVPCSKMKYCKNGGKTIIDLKDGPGSDPYRCECLRGFEGKLCEIDYLFESVILSEEASFFQLLRSWIGKNYTAKLCWWATRDGWAANTFHSKCDNKVPTVTIVKVGNYIFGGYATASWTPISSSVAAKQAPGSFLFSFRNKENLPPFKAPLKDENTQYAIYASYYGPTFGDHDLHISNNAASNTGSYTDFNYRYQAPSGVSDTKTILAGTRKFTPTEVEVFYLV